MMTLAALMFGFLVGVASTGIPFLFLLEEAARRERVGLLRLLEEQDRQHWSRKTETRPAAQYKKDTWH